MNSVKQHKAADHVRVISEFYFFKFRLILETESFPYFAKYSLVDIPDELHKIAMHHKHASMSHEDFYRNEDVLWENIKIYDKFFHFQDLKI